MKLKKSGILFDSLQSASPADTISSFTDKDGATLFIDTAILVRMYELCKFDLQYRGGWESVIARIEDTK